MITEKKTITLSQIKNKNDVVKGVDSYLRYGFVVEEIRSRTVTSTYETSGTPDTYTGHISDDGKTVTITKHPGSAGTIGSYTTTYYDIDLVREFPDMQVKNSVDALEKRSDIKNHEKKIFLIHRLLYGVYPCPEDKLDSFSKISKLSGHIFPIILCFFLAITGLFAPSALVYIIVAKADLNRGFMFLLIVYVLIGLGMTWFFGWLAIKEIACRSYKSKYDYKLYKSTVTPRYKESLEKCVNAITPSQGTPEVTKGELIKSIVLGIVLLPIPILDIFFIINMILMIRDYVRWQKLIK